MKGRLMNPLDVPLRKFADSMVKPQQALRKARKIGMVVSVEFEVLLSEGASIYPFQTVESSENTVPFYICYLLR